MSSFFIIAIAVLLNTVNKIYTKYLFKFVGSFSMLLYVNIIASVMALPFAIIYWEDINSLTLFQISFTFLTAAAWSLNGYLGNLSTEKAEVSVREPLVQLQVVWAVMIGLFVFGESLSIQQWVGISLIILGSLVLAIRKDILKVKVDKEAILLILIYTIVTAIVASMDKYVISFLRPEAYLLFNFFVPILFLVPFIKKHESEMNNAKLHIWKLILLSIAYICTFLSTLYVYKNFDFALAYPLLKIAAPLTAIFGIMIFNEKNNLGKKFIALFLVMLGVFLIKM